MQARCMLTLCLRTVPCLPRFQLQVFNSTPMLPPSVWDKLQPPAPERSLLETGDFDQTHYFTVSRHLFTGKVFRNYSHKQLADMRPLPSVLCCMGPYAREAGGGDGQHPDGQAAAAVDGGRGRQPVVGHEGAPRRAGKTTRVAMRCR